MKITAVDTAVLRVPTPKPIALEFPEQKLVVDKLIVSIGRVPYTGGLNADAVGLKLDERGMLGVTIQPINADLASSLSLPAARGAIVTSVAPGGPAERAGLKRGDVITAINNQPVVDHNSLRNQVAGMAPGSNVTVTVIRNGRDQNLQVALAEFLASQGIQAAPAVESSAPAAAKEIGPKS